LSFSSVFTPGWQVVYVLRSWSLTQTSTRSVTKPQALDRALDLDRHAAAQHDGKRASEPRRAVVRRRRGISNQDAPEGAPIPTRA
jgi:hypothetical protein